ncbi:hypothetical protein L1049_018754 [Liquidambar formosana]|uniref:Uncharacterized protein n=1 Tax=Liquidambar formosana TaxID=63359 RepID=A0AAP0RAI1_LIQFO
MPVQLYKHDSEFPITDHLVTWVDFSEALHASVGWYIQGVRIFGSSNLNSDSAVPIDNEQPTSEVASVNDKNKFAGRQTHGVMELCQKSQPIWRVRSILAWMECTIHRLVRMMN